MTTLSGVYLVILFESVRRGREMVPFIGGYAYIALIVIAALGFIVSMRR